MKIIIDADACPKGVKKICEETAAKYNIELIMVTDDSHVLQGNFKVIQVQQGDDSVDFEIIKFSQEKDIVVTQDYGLASTLIDKIYAVIHPNGFLYTKFNMDSLLFQRHMGKKIRNSNGRTKGPKKRKTEDDSNFSATFIEVLKKAGYSQ